MTVASKKLKRDLFPIIDRIAQSRAERYGATCTKGCDACCYQTVLITRPEASLIAEQIARNTPKRVKGLIPRLRAAALFAEKYGTAFGTSQDLFFQEHVPCVFLDPQAHLCTVYEDRPRPCRTHYVVSDPALCGAPPPATVLGVDMDDLNDSMLKHAAEHGSLTIAPLPAAVLFAFAEMGAPGAREAVEGLRSEESWTQGYMDDVTRTLEKTGLSVEGYTNRLKRFR